MNRRLPPPLVALSPGDLREAGAKGTAKFLDAARKAVETGLRGILVREPGMHDRSLLELARSVREILPAQGWLALHDRVHLAEDCGAQAVHLGYRSLAPAEARRILADAVAIGFSAHEGDDNVLWEACDYIFFGPVLDTPSKRGWKDPTGFERLAVAVRRSPVPVWAIGGVQPIHVAACVEAGCAGIAVRAGLLAAGDPARAARDHLRAVAESFRKVARRDRA